MKKEPLEQRFSKYFTPGAADDCWPWTGARDPWGYGVILIGRSGKRATHVALRLDGRERPEGHNALHSCDNPPCVNPAHLRWGTQAENVADRKARGRQNYRKGPDNATAKLTAAQVLHIRNGGEPSRVLAERYGVAMITIQQARNGRTYSSVHGEL